MIAMIETRQDDDDAPADGRRAARLRTSVKASTTGTAQASSVSSRADSVRRSSSKASTRACLSHASRRRIAPRTDHAAKRSDSSSAA